MDFLWNIITIQVQFPPFIVKYFYHFNSILLSYSISIPCPELSASASHWGKKRDFTSDFSVILDFVLRMGIEMPAGAHLGSDFQWGTHQAWRAVLKLISLLREPSKNIFPPTLFLAKKQTNKIIIIIKGITSLPSHSDMLSAKTQIKSVRQGENAVKTGPLFSGQSCEVFNSPSAGGCASSHCTQLLKGLWAVGEERGSGTSAMHNISHKK